MNYSPGQLYLDINPLPIIEYKNYFFGEGLITILIVIALAAVFAFISGCISLLMGIKVKDNKVIIITNIMTKTVQFILIYTSKLGLLSLIVLASCSIYIEGYIYNKLIKEKKRNGYIVSLVCNIVSVILFIICWIIYFRLNLFFRFQK